MAPESDAERRLSRALVFFKDDVDRIDTALDGYRVASRSQCSLLIDLDGHLVTQVGELRGVDVSTVAALVAGSFAATRAIARALGEEEFTTLSHQGADESLQVTLVSDRTILATVYSPRTTTAGLVCFYLASVATTIRNVLDAVRTRPGLPELGAGFDRDIGNAMDVMFGDDGA
jgi:predicted regulator of Ras-like GTPase activity (Roadblock/LC7/MglB family)